MWVLEIELSFCIFAKQTDPLWLFTFGQGNMQLKFRLKNLAMKFQSKIDGMVQRGLKRTDGVLMYVRECRCVTAFILES